MALLFTASWHGHIARFLDEELVCRGFVFSLIEIYQSCLIADVQIAFVEKFKAFVALRASILIKIMVMFKILFVFHGGLIFQEGV